MMIDLHIFKNIPWKLKWVAFYQDIKISYNAFIELVFRKEFIIRDSIFQKSEMEVITICWAEGWYSYYSAELFSGMGQIFLYTAQFLMLQ